MEYSFGKQIKVLRQAHGLSIKDLADTVGIHRDTIHNIESDKVSPSLITYESILIVFGFELDIKKT